MKRLLQYPAVTLLLTIIVIGSALLDYFVPPMGDDLLFLHQLGGDAYSCPDRGTLSFILAHIMGCNGRLFDYMGPLIINLLPRPIASAVMGGIAGLFYYSVLYACHLPQRGYQTLSACVIGTSLAAMPWWDSMYLRVCQFNYLWGATFCLLFIGVYFRDVRIVSRSRLIMIFVLGIFAGASHEQTGVTMCAALLIWLVHNGNYRNLSTVRKCMLVSLLAGTFMTVAAPGIWHRAANDTADQIPPQILLTTLPLLMMLISIVASCMLSGRGRRYILSLIRGQWGVTATAAVISGVIALYSGIPGRTGLFSEAASIVAMTRMAADIKCRIPRGAAALVVTAIIILVSVHFAVSVSTQSKLRQEYDDVTRAYIASPDGIVYYDFTNRYDVSPLTLLRVKGVADADDWWLLHALQEAYGTPEKTPVVIPSSFSGSLEFMTDSLCDGRVTIYSAEPDHVVETIDDAVLQYYPGPSPRVVTAARLSDGRDIWVATPLVLDPGDYIRSVKSPL